MAPSNLQGLNIVHPAQAHGDSQDLLSGPPFPDLSAQLDLWTNLAFDSDEGPLSRHDDDSYRNKGRRDEEEEDGRSIGNGSGESAIHAGHVNVVTGTNLGNNQSLEGVSQPQQQFDLQAFLAGFGIDPFSAPPVPSQADSNAPSLAQLLALHSAQGGVYAPPPAPMGAAGGISTSSHRSSLDDDSVPANKRARTRKVSISTTVSSPEDHREETPAPSNGAPLSAAEDKRRRNTAASARFRLKKKEREAALEGKAKELEGRVQELERECEGLRRENGWLKGLVVGVTGAAQAPTIPTTIGTKRGRDEVEAA